MPGMPSSSHRPLTVAVVGATGVVGRTMISVLDEREFPMGELRLLASGRSAGTRVTANGRTLEVGEALPEAFDGVDIALFSAGADVSLDLAPSAAARGATVIDNSSAWRMDPKVPLIVSQVNPDDGEWHEGIVANPNCSTMQLVPVLMAIRDCVGIERVVVDTYQSVSGTGSDALAELETQVRAHVAGEPKQASVYPHQIAFNALPEIDVFLDDGYTREERKVIEESRKILHLPDLRLSCTAVRIPVFVSHSEAVHVETSEPLTPDRARALFAEVPGVVVQDDPRQPHVSPGDRGRRSRRDLRRPGPPGPVDRRRARDRVLGGQRQPPEGRRDERRGDRRAARCSRLDPGEIASGSGRRRRIGGRRSDRRDRGARVTEDERREALEAVADEVRVCTRCRLHEGRTKAVPGEGSPSTEVMFVGEGPGLNEDRQGRPFVGAAGQFLTELLGSVGWSREDVFITNVVKCRPPQNRDPEPDEIAACDPFLRRQMAILEPAMIVTLGRHSMGRFQPGARIGQVHGTVRPAPDDSGAGDASVFAMYHPAAALHQGSLRQTLLDDMARVPDALLDARRRRAATVTPEPLAIPIQPEVAPVLALASLEPPPLEAEPAWVPVVESAAVPAPQSASEAVDLADDLDAALVVVAGFDADAPAGLDVPDDQMPLF